ncbi:hypothetical protein M408DRAFT_330161 [Serendipita vermifera MAFF 305830]|uniref:STE3-domain-containing protein n=1 Tax=Serendipita vermifera MAFF 305830 TaxID=933852 RepID=A0A0C3B715_SERVB|nr:hypothetical protein M408DRAFT_330161 [Serendipita vermifera MAFF 305830]
MQDLNYLYPAFPIICSFVIVGTIIPIPVHWRAGNTATVSLGLWTLSCNIVFLVGTITWHGNIDNPYPIWGDIVNVYLSMFPTGLASSALCVQYRLWTIAKAKTVFITKKDQQRQKYVTWFLCLGLPMLVAVLHYIVQGHRYNLWEDIGPVIATYNVTLAYPIYLMWDSLICVICAVYSILTIRLFLARRKEYDAVLASGSSINKDKYSRLLCLAAVSVVFHLPLSLWVMLYSATVLHVSPWISWEDTHSNYGRIAYYSRLTLSQLPDLVTQMSVVYWSTALCGFNYFILFAFGEEVVKYYQGIIGAMLKPFGIQYPKKRKRNAVKRTRLDAILGGPKPTTSHPSPGGTPGAHNSDQTRTHTMTANDGNDFHLDVDNLEFLNPFEARKQALISAYTSPGQAIRDSQAEKGRAFGIRRPSLAWSIFRQGNDKIEEEESPGIADETPGIEESNSVAKAGSDPSTLKENRDAEGDVDLEAQDPSESVIQQERRRAILENNPELTEEVTF